MKKRVNLLLSIIVSLSFFAGCSNNNSSSVNIQTNIDELPKIEEPTFYDNKFDEEKIPGQWSAYGVGDPFVLRHNGRYYLYCSTKNFETGVRGWVSDDLINYEPMTAEGLETGYVSYDPCTVTAYAPEVMYRDGYFYMVQSQGGSGHYILRSEKPEGPFVSVTGNFGESIDGSFFIDDDEQMYLLRASNTGIRLIQLNDDLTLGTSRTLDNTVLGGWTEGPYLLKRDGIYYLTYTGNHVTSEGYRIAYSYSSDKLFARDAFTEGDTIVLNTNEDFKGLGHSSTVMGPDLDSYYLAYHNLNSSGGPNRSNNISRLSFSGTEMIVEHAELHNNITPTMASFSTNDKTGLEEVGSMLLSKDSTKDTYSAEFNFIGNNATAVVSYLDENNYHTINLNNDVLTFVKVSDGKSSEIEKVEFNKDYNYDVLHTLRIAHKDGKVIVYFDNLNKISLEDHSMKAGRIGYINNSIEIKHTSFSNVAHGSSDNETIHQSRFLATNYYSSSFTSSSNVVNTPKEGEEDYYNGKINSYDLNLNKKGDHATYKIYVEEDGRYGIDMVLPQEYAGKKVIFKVDNDTPVRFEIPSSNECYYEYYKAPIGELELTKGAHYLSIICDDEIRFHEVSYYKSSKTHPLFEHDLSDYVLEGARYVSSWKIRDNGHYALSGNRNLMYFGDETLTDFTLEVDIELVGETQASSCGIIVRGDNPAFASVDTVSSIQGYYVGFNNSKVFISKCDYNKSEMDASADAHKSESGVTHHLKIVVRGNKIELDFDNGDVNLTYVDSIGFTHGSVGLYTDGAASIYRNLKIYY